MTDAVSLALIALVGVVVFLLSITFIIKDVLKSNPTHLKLCTEYGEFEADFDTKAGK